MSQLRIGEMEEDGWILRDRRGQAELMESSEGRWGIYVYEHVGEDEHWLVWCRRDDEETALDIFDRVARLLGRTGNNQRWVRVNFLCRGEGCERAWYEYTPVDEDAWEQQAESFAKSHADAHQHPANVTWDKRLADGPGH